MGIPSLTWPKPIRKGMEADRHPICGVDYPRTFQDMEERFREDAACREYIRLLRWPDEFVCPHCLAQDTFYVGTLKGSSG
jgi:hypothetical protein